MSPVIPTALSIQGGGFIVQSMAMGFANTFYQSGFIDQITHLGGISGGTWFATQFAYSEEFYESVTGINGNDPTEAATIWGKTYEAAMKEAIQELTNPYSAGELSALCAATQPISNTTDTTFEDIFESLLNNLADRLYWPAPQYLYYVSSFLDPFVPNSNLTSFDTPRQGIDATLVIGVSLGPDVFNNDGTKTVSLEGWDKDFVPLVYTATAENEMGWWYYGLDTGMPLILSTGARKSKITVELDLNDNASIAEVAAGSGSALGFTGSPTLMKRAISIFLKSPDLNLSPLQQVAFSQAINLCLPLGLQNISSPLLSRPESVDNVPWSPQYRYMDGSVSGDSTSVPFTVAKMQKDCIAQNTKYACANEPFKVALISDGERNQFPAKYSLFANCTGDCRALGGPENAYQPQVFAEAYPTDDDPGWVLYSNKSYTFSVPGKADKVTPYLPSYVWRGDLTTVDNPIWNIKAGTQIDFVMFAVAYPSEDYIIWPGLYAEFAWHEIYGQVAEEHASSTRKLFETNPSIGSFFSSGQTPTEKPLSSSRPTPTENPSSPVVAGKNSKKGKKKKGKKEQKKKN